MKVFSLDSPENEEKHGSLRCKEEVDGGEDDEALSLCDLPVNLPENKGGEARAIKTDEDFDFGSWNGTLSAENPKMCVADEVFYKGQLLPLHSDNCAGFRRNPSRTMSMDHGGVSRVTSLSSTSSSSGSGISSNTWCASAKTPNSNPIKIKNNFHTHPSPNPQIRAPKTRPSSRNQRSSPWDFFRLGLIRAPEIEFQDIKPRKPTNFTSGSRNSSCSSGSSSESKNQSRGLNLNFFGGCKCSAVETVALNNINVVIKSSKSERLSIYHGSTMDEMKKMKKSEENERKEGKQALSQHRTFEWLKELSLSGYVENS